MEVTTLLSDTFRCRLCAEENKHGTNLYRLDEEKNKNELSELINKYLPLKVNPYYVTI